MIEIFILFWFYGILIYITRNIIRSIPFPFNGYKGYDHYIVKELNMPIIFTFTFSTFCDYLKNKMQYFYKRITKEFDKIKL